MELQIGRKKQENWGKVSIVLCPWFLKAVDEPEGVHETFAFDLHLGGHW